VGVDLGGGRQSDDQAAAVVVPVAAAAVLPPSALATSPHVFARQEKKYLLAPGVGERLLARLGGALTADDPGPTRITNLYLDTLNYLLIRRSIEKPDFKEKLRVRAYGSVANDSHPVFLEVKKKYLGTVYKRRVRMTLREVQRFVEDGIMPPLAASLPRRSNPEKAALNRQIMAEMRWAFERYGRLAPVFRVEYERCAYAYRAGSASLRLTIDRDACWSRGRWEMEDGSVRSYPLLAAGTGLMEIKTTAPLPLSLAHVLDELELYPRSFSKVGCAYGIFVAAGERGERQ
jgi:hypothetical protein